MESIRLPASSIIFSINEVHGIASVVLRLTNTYGPRMRIKDARQTFSRYLDKKPAQGKPIQVFGDGQQRRDYNYVEDVLDALMIAATENECYRQGL